MADLEGREVNVDARDGLVELLQLVVATVGIPGDEHLEVQEVPTDLVHIHVIINTCVTNSDIVIPAPAPSSFAARVQPP